MIETYPTLIAALIRKYGEKLPNGDVRLVLSVADVVEMSAIASVSVKRDLNQDFEITYSDGTPQANGRKRVNARTIKIKELR